MTIQGFAQVSQISWLTQPFSIEMVGIFQCHLPTLSSFLYTPQSALVGRSGEGPMRLLISYSSPFCRNEKNSDMEVRTPSVGQGMKHNWGNGVRAHSTPLISFPVATLISPAMPTAGKAGLCIARFSFGKRTLWSGE